MKKVNIRDYSVIDGNHVLVTASVSHGRNQPADPKDVMIGLHNATQGRLSAVADSFVELESEPVRTIVQGVMSLSHAVLPVTDNMEQQGFKAIASNIFMDEKENIWNIEQTENGKVAVRSNTIDDPEELQALLSKCSTPITKGTDPSYFKAVAASHIPDAPKSGSFVTFVDDSKTKFGVVVSSVFETEDPVSYTGQVIVLASDGQESKTIPEDLIVANAGQVDYPEDEEMQATAATGNVGKSQIEMLVDYYRKVFGHNPEYFAELEKRIRNHNYA